MKLSLSDLAERTSLLEATLASSPRRAGPSQLAEAPSPQQQALPVSSADEQPQPEAAREEEYEGGEEEDDEGSEDTADMAADDPPDVDFPAGDPGVGPGAADSGVLDWDAFGEADPAGAPRGSPESPPAAGAASAPATHSPPDGQWVAFADDAPPARQEQPQQQLGDDVFEFFSQQQRAQQAAGGGAAAAAPAADPAEAGPSPGTLASSGGTGSFSDFLGLEGAAPAAGRPTAGGSEE